MKRQQTKEIKLIFSFGALRWMTTLPYKIAIVAVWTGTAACLIWAAIYASWECLNSKLARLGVGHSSIDSGIGKWDLWSRIGVVDVEEEDAGAVGDSEFENGWGAERCLHTNNMTWRGEFLWDEIYRLTLRTTSVLSVKCHFAEPWKFVRAYGIGVHK